MHTEGNSYELQYGCDLMFNIKDALHDVRASHQDSLHETELWTLFTQQTQTHLMVLWEDFHVALLPVLIIPQKFDTIGLHVLHAELPHLEGGADHGALEGTAAGHGLVLVESGGGGLGEHLEMQGQLEAVSASPV